MTKNVGNIVEELQKMINENEFKVNEKLPSEIKMAKYFNVSRMTYRAAVKKLQEDGKLYIKHGSGTFVVPSLPKIESSIEKLESIGNMIKKAGFKEDGRQEKLDFIKCNDEVAEVLKIKTGDKVVIFKRYRTANDDPIAYSINYMPHSIIGEAFEKYEFSGSLFKFLSYQCDIDISCADSEFCVPDIESEETREIFKNMGNRIMLIKQLHYTLDNTPILYSYDYLRNDIFNFCIRRRR